MECTLQCSTHVHMSNAETLLQNSASWDKRTLPSSVTLLSARQICSQGCRLSCRRVITQNKKFYTRFPQDVAIVQRLVMHLDSLPEGGAPLPRGGTLTPRALQLLGLGGMGSAGGFERLHFFLEGAFDDGELSPVFLLVRPHLKFCCASAWLYV